ncbi:hypothetical protein FRB96_003911 [Tulasnella sp. 330]|nr:hypothetical protein FRB96_003911 [Tulasnella sp. 330]KAG8873738.1 hypothetical protein FRB98_008810 [Tulasnella sp. 332]
MRQVASESSATGSLTALESIAVPSAQAVADPEDPFVAVEEPQVNQPNVKPVKTLDRHEGFFLDPIFFLVEDKLYCVPEMMFPGAGYLESTSGHGTGKSEDDPMHLDITISQMDSLMSVILARQISSPVELNIVQWGQALGLSTRWKLGVARNFAIDQITHHFPYHLASHISLADAYDVGMWLNPAYHIIATRDDPPTEAEVAALGPKRLVALYKIREACHQPSATQGVDDLIDASEDLKVVPLSRPRTFGVDPSPVHSPPDDGPRTVKEHVVRRMKTLIESDIKMTYAATTVVGTLDVEFVVKVIVKEEPAGGCSHQVVCNPRWRGLTDGGTAVKAETMEFSLIAPRGGVTGFICASGNIFWTLILAWMKVAKGSFIDVDEVLELEVKAIFMTNGRSEIEALLLIDKAVIERSASQLDASTVVDVWLHGRDALKDLGEGANVSQ